MVTEVLPSTKRCTECEQNLDVLLDINGEPKMINDRHAAGRCPNKSCSESRFRRGIENYPWVPLDKIVRPTHQAD